MRAGREAAGAADSADGEGGSSSIVSSMELGGADWPPKLEAVPDGEEDAAAAEATGAEVTFVLCAEQPSLRSEVSRCLVAVTARYSPLHSPR